MNKFHKTYILVLSIGLMTIGTVSAESKPDGQDPMMNFSILNPVEIEISILPGTVNHKLKKPVLHLLMDDQSINSGTWTEC